MTEASYASLGPTLLARKGGAKPAMRPQLAPLPETIAEEALEDLGWNDMGSEDLAPEDKSANSAANVVALSPTSANDEPESPVVKRQQKDLAQRILADAAMPSTEAETAKQGSANADEADDSAGLIKAKPRKPAPKAKATTKAKAKAKAHRAAFTLRLDNDRHLKLRLAATMQGVSAQALVTEALDRMLGEIKDLESIAARMKRN